MLRRRVWTVEVDFSFEFGEGSDAGLVQRTCVETQTRVEWDCRRSYWALWHERRREEEGTGCTYR